jgi:hypothetical protein
MTSWGNTKQRACAGAAIGFFIVAILCGIESTNSGAAAFMKGAAIVTLVFGLISLGGIWSMGLAKGTDPDDWG